MRTSRLSREVGRVTTALQSDSRRAGLRSRTNESVKPQNVTDIEESGSCPSLSGSRKRKRSSKPTTASKSVSESNSFVKEDVPAAIDEQGGTMQSADVSFRSRRAKRQPAKQETDHNGDVVIHPPPNWDEVYRTTAQMRRLNPAPVDTMGCETLAEEGLSERDRRFQTLIALMLSSQTKDTVTALAMRRLQTELPRPGLTLECILEVEPEYLNQLIWQVGFHNNKTKYIKMTAEALRDQHDGDIPDTIEGLRNLPGVGPKMAYLCMSAAWGRDEGIGVDVHVHRITNLWGWHKTKTPEETRATLEAWLPKEKWHDINHLLVGFGQTICLPIGRKCNDCTLSSKGLCPSAVVDRRIRSRKLKTEEGNIPKQEFIEENSTIDGDKTILKTTITTGKEKLIA